MSFKNVRNIFFYSIFSLDKYQDGALNDHFNPVYEASNDCFYDSAQLRMQENSPFVLSQK